MTSVPEEPEIAPDGLIARPRSQWRVLKDMVQPRWIKRAAQETWGFAPCCAGPAAVFTAASLVENLGFKAALSLMSQPKLEIANLFGSIGILFATLIVTLVLLIWALVGWLARFTAFSRYFLSRMTNPAFQRETAKADRESAISETKKQKRSLTKFWLFVTVLLLVPLGMIMILATAIGLCSPPIAGPMAIPMPLPVVQGMATVLVVFALVLFTYSLVAVAVSACCDQNPKKSALDAFRWTFTLSPTTFLLTVFMFIVVGVISSPDELIQPMSFEQYFGGTRNTWILIAGTIWGGITSVFLWPFAIAPFCELLKDRIGVSTDH